METLGNGFLKIIKCAHTEKLLGYYYNRIDSPNGFYAWGIEPILGEFYYKYFTHENSLIKILDFEVLDLKTQEHYNREILNGNLIRLANSGSYLVPLGLINYFER